MYEHRYMEITITKCRLGTTLKSQSKFSLLGIALAPKRRNHNQIMKFKKNSWLKSKHRCVPSARQWTLSELQCCVQTLCKQDNMTHQLITLKLCHSDEEIASIHSGGGHLQIKRGQPAFEVRIIHESGWTPVYPHYTGGSRIGEKGFQTVPSQA